MGAESGSDTGRSTCSPSHAQRRSRFCKRLFSATSALRSVNWRRAKNPPLARAIAIALNEDQEFSDRFGAVPYNGRVWLGAHMAGTEAPVDLHMDPEEVGRQSYECYRLEWEHMPL